MENETFPLDLTHRVLARFGFDTVEQIKRRNADAGFFYFSPETMRFFRCRVSPIIFGGRFFITSEQYRAMSGDMEPRKYSIRFAYTNGNIEHVSEFQAFRSLAQAKRAAKKAAEDHHFIEKVNGKYRAARIVSTSGAYVETTLGTFSAYEEAEACITGNLSDIAEAIAQA